LVVEQCIEFENPYDYEILGSIMNHVILGNMLDDDMGMTSRCLSFLQIYKIGDICIGSFFLQKFDPKNVHNMLWLMLDP
jgi:hypothetical protein